MASMLDRLWSDYEEHHRTQGNKYCHGVGIPLIITGLLGLFSFPIFRIGPVPVEPALLMVVASGGMYLWLDPKLGAGMAIATLLLYLGARSVYWPWTLGLFAAGWVLQFIGHGVFEKRSPAFLGNLAHLLIGPMWVLNHFVPLRGKRPALPSGVRG